MGPCHDTRPRSGRPGRALRRNLVRRVRDTGDRRYLTVHLTAAGRRLIREVFPGHVAAIVAELSALTAREQEELGRLAKKLGLASARRGFGPPASTSSASRPGG